MGQYSTNLYVNCYDSIGKTLKRKERFDPGPTALCLVGQYSTNLYVNCYDSIGKTLKRKERFDPGSIALEADALPLGNPGWEQHDDTE